MPKSFVNSVRGLFTIAACSLLMNVPAYAQDRTADVAAVKQQVIAAGIDLEHGPGECGRFEVTKRFAWKFRAEGFGLIAKFGAQNGCSATDTLNEPKYGVDAVLLPDGRCFDIIGKGNEGPNTPHWITCTSSASLYRAPFDPGDVADPPPPPPPPVDLTARVVALEQANKQLTQALIDLAEHVDAMTDIFNTITAKLDQRVHALEVQPKPPTECRASVFGIPVSCRLVP